MNSGADRLINHFLILNCKLPGTLESWSIPRKDNHFLVSFLCFHSKAITITFPHIVLFLYFLDPGILSAPSWLVTPERKEIAIEGRGKTLYCLATGRFVVPNTLCKKKINVFSKSEVHILPDGLYGTWWSLFQKYNFVRALHSESGVLCTTWVLGRFVTSHYTNSISELAQNCQNSV